jgi:hypothetical protein
MTRPKASLFRSEPQPQAATGTLAVMVFAFLPLLLMTFTFLGRYIAFTEPRQDPAKNKPLAFCFGVG